MVNRDILKKILEDNRQMVSDLKIIKRKFSFNDEARYVFVGVRRSGKSFLMFQRMQQLIEQGLTWDDMLYVNFEEDRLWGFDVFDFDAILETHKEMGGKKPILFLDEIQIIDGWEKFARRLADHKYMVYITGSNAKMLSSDIATTLGGRYVIKNVYPYDLNEYLAANQVDSDDLFFDVQKRHDITDEYLKNGGFPECATYEAKKEYLFSLYQKIFLGDIAMRNKIENSNALRMMFLKMAESVMQPIALTRLANLISSIGVKTSKNTIINYAGYARDAFLIIPIANFADNITDRETNQKYYFIDNGIISLLSTDCITSQLENLVALTLIRRHGTDGHVFFYNYNVEVDFIIPEKEMAIQVSYSLGNEDSETFRREVNALLRLAKRFPYRDLKIITYDEEDTYDIEGHTISVTPIWKWLLLPS